MIGSAPESGSIATMPTSVDGSLEPTWMLLLAPTSPSLSSNLKLPPMHQAAMLQVHQLVMITSLSRSSESNSIAELKSPSAKKINSIKTVPLSTQKLREIARTLLTRSQILVLLQWLSELTEFLAFKTAHLSHMLSTLKKNATHMKTGRPKKWSDTATIDGWSSVTVNTSRHSSEKAKRTTSCSQCHRKVTSKNSRIM